MRLILGDCFDVLRTLDDESVDAVITDPPYGINFMGNAWDGAAIEEAAQRERESGREMPPRLTGSPDSPSRKLVARSGSAYSNRAGAAGAYDLSPKGNYAFQEWTQQWAEDALRILKPGGHVVCFASTRTYHRMVCGIEDAGFQIRDTLMWIQGQGFPKSLNLGGGLGTNLKPAFEPIVLARKPPGGTIAETVTRYGTGALNIDATRIGTSDTYSYPNGPGGKSLHYSSDKRSAEVRPNPTESNPLGRWPSNVLLSHSDGCIIVGYERVAGRTIRRPVEKMLPFGGGAGKEYETIVFPDETVALWDCMGECPVRKLEEPARFFYQPKVSVSERNAGCGELPITETHRYNPGIGEGVDPLAPAMDRNHHPTIKPIDLMRWLCRLITPPGGLILDPFMGSGSTAIAAHLEGFDFIGVEREENYMSIAKARLEFWRQHGDDGLRIVAERDRKLQEAMERRQAHVEVGQLELELG